MSRSRIIKIADIVPKLNEAIRQRILIKPKSKLIIHIDKGTNFTNSSYNQFIEQNKDFIQVSMLRANTPKDNSVVERFIRTFKEHKISNKNFKTKSLEYLNADTSATSLLMKEPDYSKLFL